MATRRYLAELRDTIASLRAQQVRAFLTLLGIIIGVGTLVFLASLVEGAGAFLAHGMQQASGTDIISVTPGYDTKSNTRNTLDRFDAQAVQRATTPDGALVLGRYVKRVPTGTRWGERVYVVGTVPEATRLYDLGVAEGRFITQADVWAQTPVAVLGAGAGAALLPAGTAALGAEVKLKGQRFKVVGVLARKATTGGGQRWTWDTSVVVPEPVFRQRFAAEVRLDEIVVRASPEQLVAHEVGRLAYKVSAVLGARRPGTSAFDVRDPTTTSNEGRLVGMIVYGLEAAIAGVCLGVGGINIMNIMLVSVAQRRREIGLRRALGATRSAIQRQFLVEAGVLAGLGGVLGIAAGNALAWLSSLILTALLGHWPFVPAPWQMALGLGAAVLTGLVFGWWPARQAAALKPIECLRAD